MSFTSTESHWGDVWLAAGTRAVSACGDLMAATTLALVLHGAGHGGPAVSGLLLAAGAPPAVLAPITGRLADRADSRTLLVVAGGAQAAVCLALAFVTSPALIIALVAVLATGLAVTQPVIAALLPEMVRRDDLAKAGGINQTAGMIGMLIAPALAGLLVGQVGARVPLLLDAVSYLALVAAGRLLRTRRRPGAPGAVTAPATGWRLRDDRILTVMVAALAAAVGGVNAINVVEVFFIRDTLHASTTVFGLVSASWTTGMLIGAVLFGRVGRRWITVRMLLALMAGSCVPVLLGAAVPTALLLVPLWVFGGICNGGINVGTMVIIADRAPAGARGRAYAAMNSAVQGAGMVGLFAAGPLLEFFAPRPLVAAAGAAGLLATLACLPMVRREPSSDPPASAPVQARVSVRG
jgi:MFS family permease